MTLSTMPADLRPTALETAEPVLELAGITKKFGDLIACNDVSLRLHQGEIIALLGENGAGKTTLMNILFGHYVADQGRVSVGHDGRALQRLKPGSPMAALNAGIGMVHQHFTLAENLTALDNIMLGTESSWSLWQDREAAIYGLQALMRDCGLHVDLDQPTGTLTVGERQRVEILKALYRGCHILVLDEPTAVLAPQDAAQLFKTLQHLARQHVGIIFITHKLAEVRAIADRLCILRNGKLVADWAPNNVSDDQIAEMMVGRMIDEPAKAAIQPGAPLLEFGHVSLTQGRSRLDDISLAIRAQEIVGIAGITGNGQRSLASLVAGTAQPDAGELRLFGTKIKRNDPAAMIRAGIGRIPEDRHRHGIVGDMSVWENLLLETCRDDQRWNRLGIIAAGDAQQFAADTVQKYRVRCPSVTARAELLSGGNIQKLILARMFEQRPRLILADQPTRGLDLGAVMFIHEKLLEARAMGAGILLISEDLDELLTLADRIHVIFRGQLSKALPADMLNPAKIGLLMAGQADAA